MYTPDTILPTGNFKDWPIKHVPLSELIKLARSGDAQMRQFLDSLSWDEKFGYQRNGKKCPYPKPESWNWGPRCDYPRIIPPKIEKIKPQKPIIQLTETTCTKTTYTTLKTAKNHCIFPRNHLRPYICKRCGLWHLTSKL